MKIIQRLYTIYAITVFIILFLIFVPVLAILSSSKRLHPIALKLHIIWSWSFFTLVCIRVEIENKSTAKLPDQYILCANHFSYLDIPAVLLRFSPKFIGKNSLNTIPIFGYFYRKIHITVDRLSVRSRGESVKKTQQAINEGFNVAFFPEGGILVLEENLPTMVPFRNGAFIVSVENNIPIVPVTFPNNFLILPDKKPIQFHPHRCKIVVHEAIYPDANNRQDLEMKRLKDLTATTIQQELNAHHPDIVHSVQ